MPQLDNDRLSYRIGSLNVWQSLITSTNSLDTDTLGNASNELLNECTDFVVMLHCSRSDKVPIGLNTDTCSTHYTSVGGWQVYYGTCRCGVSASAGTCQCKSVLQQSN